MGIKVNPEVLEIMNKYGVSKRTAYKYRKNGVPPDKQNVTPPPHSAGPAIIQAENDATLDHSIADMEEQLFSVQNAPPDIFPKEKPLDKVFKALGLNTTKEETKEVKDKKTYNPNLNKAQQSLFDAFSPMAVQAFIWCSTWAWTRLGPEYTVLAPDKEVAQKIIHPICRIYARHSKVAASLDPDAIDMTASFTALIGYAVGVTTLYNQIKADKERYQNEQENYTQYSSSQNGRTNRDDSISTSQNGHDSEDTRRYDVRANSRVNGANTTSVGYARNFNPSNLNESDRHQYEALSKLRRLDLESRTRRSGRP